MNISHHAWKCNQGGIFGAKGISTESLSQQANSDNTHLYLTPDYFLPSSHSESYYSKKYSSNHTATTINTISHHNAANIIAGINPIYQSKSSKISRVASVMLLSLSFLATAVEVKAQPNLESEASTSSYAKQSPLQQQVNFQSSQQQPKKKPLFTRAAHKAAKRLGFSRVEAATREPEISMAELKELYAVEYGESIDDAMSKRIERNKTLADILRHTLDIRERELTNTLDALSDTVSVTSSSGISEMSNDSNSGSKSDKHIWQDHDIEIEQVFTDEFISRVVDQTLDTSSSGYRGSDIASNNDISSPDSGDINGSFDFTPLRANLEYSDTTQFDDTFTTSHNTQNWEWDTEWDDSSDYSDDDTSSLYSEATNVEEYDTVYTSSSEYSDNDSEYPNSDSEYDLISEQENDSETDTNFVSRENVDLPLPSLQTQESEVSEPANHNILLAIADTEDDAVISDTESAINNTDLGVAEDIESDNVAITEQNDAAIQTTSLDQETLLKKAEALSYISHDELRVARKVASNHIKQRMFERNMLVAVAAGDESEADHSQILGYSVWSSGAFGSAKQKTSNSSNGYSSKILGGTIGADVKFENELLLGASFSKIRSNTKHANQSANKKLNTYIASLYGTSPIKEHLTFGVIGSAGFSPKARAKLFSLETHLNYQIALPQDIKLIPNIGFKYEYERSKGYQEQIGVNISIAHAKRSYQAFSTEIGSRVIFAPIKPKEVCTSNVILSNTILTPTAHFAVERRIGSRGASNPYHFTSIANNEGSSEDIGISTLSINPHHQKTSLNAGIGLIANHKNIKLELLYDHTRQKRFKAHQGMLKLKVNL